MHERECVWVVAHVCVCVYAYVCGVRVHKRIRVFTYVSACVKRVCARMCVCSRMCACVYVCVEGMGAWVTCMHGHMLMSACERVCVRE